MNPILIHSDRHVIRSDGHSEIFLPPCCADVAAESCATCPRSNRFCVEHWSKHTSAAAGRTATASTDLDTGPNDICPSASLERAAGSAEIMCQTTSTNRSRN